MWQKVCNTKTRENVHQPMGSRMKHCPPPHKKPLTAAQKKTPRFDDVFPVFKYLLFLVVGFSFLLSPLRGAPPHFSLLDLRTCVFTCTYIDMGLDCILESANACKSKMAGREVGLFIGYIRGWGWEERARRRNRKHETPNKIRR